MTRMDIFLATRTSIRRRFYRLLTGPLEIAVQDHYVVRDKRNRSLLPGLADMPDEGHLGRLEDLLDVPNETMEVRRMVRHQTWEDVQREHREAQR